MANDSYTQQALAADPTFIERVRASLGTAAWAVLDEANTVPNHAQRIAYAHSVLNNLQASAMQVSPWLVMRPNLVAFATSYSFPQHAVITAAGDPDILSQLTTDWDKLAGVV